METLLRYQGVPAQAGERSDNTATRMQRRNNNTTPDIVEIVALGKLLHERMLRYKHNVLRGIGVRMPTIHQLCVMQDVLNRGNMLSVSLPDLMKYGYYNYFDYDTRKLRTSLDTLVVRGILHKSVRQAYANVRRAKTVVVFGMTDKARVLLDEYYAWIGGAHDAEFVGKPVKVVRSHRGK